MIKKLIQTNEKKKNNQNIHSLHFYSKHCQQQASKYFNDFGNNYYNCCNGIGATYIPQFTQKKKKIPTPNLY